MESSAFRFEASGRVLVGLEAALAAAPVDNRLSLALRFVRRSAPAIDISPIEALRAVSAVAEKSDPQADDVAFVVSSAMMLAQLMGTDTRRAVVRQWAADLHAHATTGRYSHVSGCLDVLIGLSEAATRVDTDPLWVAACAGFLEATATQRDAHANTSYPTLSVAENVGFHNRAIPTLG